MARWTRMALAGVLAAVLAVVLPVAAPAQTADEPSFFESLWSGIAGAVGRITSAGEDAATASPVVEAESVRGAPSLSSARWIGFTPAIVGGEAAGEGAWIAGPFAGAGTTVWVTDTVSGLTVEVRLVWREGGIFVFDDTYRHEVLNETPDERVILIFDFDRPMRFWGRQLNSLFVGLLKLSAFYQEPKRKMKGFEDRFEAATLRASANLEKLSDPEN